MWNPPTHTRVLAMHGALTRCPQSFSKVASQGPTVGFPPQASHESRSAGSQSWGETTSGDRFRLLLAGTQQEKVELVLAAGAEFLCKGPSGRRQLPLHPISWQYSPIRSLFDPQTFPEPPTPTWSYKHTIPPSLLSFPFSPNIDFSLLGFLKR